jgi:hypothetical protein
MMMAWRRPCEADMQVKRHFLDRSSETFRQGKYTIKTVFHNRWSARKGAGPVIGYIMRYGVHDYDAMDDRNQVLVRGVPTLVEALLAFE